MSLEAQQRGLFIVVSRKRDRSPSSEREESLLSTPTTPPATERKRMFDEDDDWGVTTQEWGHNDVSGIQEPHKKPRIWPWWSHDDVSSDFYEDSPSHLPVAMPTFDLSADDSLNVGTPSHTQSGLLPLSWEDIANASAAVTALDIMSRPSDHKPVGVQPAPTREDLQSGHPDDDESSENPGGIKHRRAGEENCLGNPP